MTEPDAEQRETMSDLADQADMLAWECECLIKSMKVLKDRIDAVLAQNGIKGEADEG